MVQKTSPNLAEFCLMSGMAYPEVFPSYIYSGQPDKCVGITCGLVRSRGDIRCCKGVIISRLLAVAIAIAIAVLLTGGPHRNRADQLLNVSAV